MELGEFRLEDLDEGKSTEFIAAVNLNDLLVVLRHHYQVLSPPSNTLYSTPWFKPTNLAFETGTAMIVLCINVPHDSVFISALLVLTPCHQVSQQQPVQQRQEYGSTQVMMTHA